MLTVVSYLVPVPRVIQRSKDWSALWIQTWDCSSHMICSNQASCRSEHTTWITQENNNPHIRNHSYTNWPHLSVTINLWRSRNQRVCKISLIIWVTLESLFKGRGGKGFLRGPKGRREEILITVHHGIWTYTVKIVDCIIYTFTNLVQSSMHPEKFCPFIKIFILRWSRFEVSLPVFHHLL